MKIILLSDKKNIVIADVIVMEIKCEDMDGDGYGDGNLDGCCCNLNF